MIGGAIVEILKGDDIISGAKLCNGRIFLGKIPRQDIAFPIIIVREPFNTAEEDLEGQDGSIESALQIDVYSKSAVQASIIAARICTRVLPDFKGSVKGCDIEDFWDLQWGEFEEKDPSETYRQMITGRTRYQFVAEAEVDDNG